MIKNSIKYLVIGIIAATLVFSLCGCINISVTKGDSADAKVKLNLESSGSKDVLVGSGTASSDVRKLDIEWVAGDLNIIYDDVEEIKFEEYAVKEIKDEAKMRYEEKKGTLTINFCESKTVNDVPSKDLTITLPNGLSFDEIKIDIVSSDVTLPKGLEAEKVLVNCVSGNIVSKGEVCLPDVTIDAVSGDVDLEINNLEKMEVNEVSGSVKLTLPKDTDFEVKVDSLSGKFNSEFETNKDKDTYVHGFGGGAKIQVDSMSGDITICMQK